MPGSTVITWPGLERPRGAERGNALRRRREAAVGGAEVAADIVDLDAEEVAEAVGEEGAGEALVHGRLGAGSDDLLAGEHAGEFEERRLVELAPGAPGANRCRERLLGALDRVEERAETLGGALAGVGSRDVRGVAPDPGAGVEEEAPAPARLGAFAFVVEDGSLLVQADDRRVREVGFEPADRGEEGPVDIELAASRTEGLGGGAVPGRPDPVRFGEARDLVGRLHRATPVEPAEELRRIRGEAERLGEPGALGDGGDAALRERPPDLGELALPAPALGDPEAGGPEGVADLRALVPEVVGAPGDEERPLAGAKQEQVARRLERAEVEEVRVGPERRRLVVAEVVVVGARREQEAGVTGGLQVLGDPGEAGLEVVGEEIGERAVHGAREDTRNREGGAPGGVP